MTIILSSLGDGHQSVEFTSPLHKVFFIKNFSIVAGKQSIKKGAKCPLIIVSHPLTVFTKK